jgi:hypothetical protein
VSAEYRPNKALAHGTTEQVDLNTSDLYAGGSGITSQPGHRLSWRKVSYSPKSFPDQCHNNISSQTTAVSIHIPVYYLLTSHPFDNSPRSLLASLNKQQINKRIHAYMEL